MNITENAPIVYAYIDPGTGSMLFTILVGAIGVLFYGLKGLLIKLKYFFSSDKSKKEENNIPLVIFSDDKRYWTTFKPICDELEKRRQNTVYMTFSEDDPALKSDYEYVKAEHIKGFARLNALKADIVLSTTPSLDVYQWKRSKDVKWYVHVLHMANDATSYRMFGLDYYDAVILSGEFQREQLKKLEEQRNTNKKEMLVLGLPYLDQLYERKEKTNNVHGVNKTVLLAPSWGNNSIINRYGSKIIDALLITGYHIIVRPHPQSFTSEKQLIDELMNKYPDLEWNRDNDNFDVLNRSDILISDFSGVIFDFAMVFDKPVIYADTSFDKSIYDAWWLDEEMWTFKALPRLGRQLKEEDLDHLKEFIDSCTDSEEIKKGREEVKKECWANRGYSSSLIADYLINKLKELNEVTES